MRKRLVESKDWKRKSPAARQQKEKKNGGNCQHTHTHRKDLHLIWEGPGANELPHRLLPSPSTPPVCCVIQWDDVRGQGAQTHRKHSVNSKHRLSAHVCACE